MPQTNPPRLTFVSAVPEGSGTAHAARALLQGGGAAPQRVALPVQLKRVVGRDAVGAAHAGGAGVRADVGGTHWTHTHTDTPHEQVTDPKNRTNLWAHMGSVLTQKHGCSLRRLE